MKGNTTMDQDKDAALSGTEPAVIQGSAPSAVSYGVILADPPWRYRVCRSRSRRIENQYPTMLIDEICALRVPSGEDAVLYLWSTAPMLEDALRVMGAWGFKYKTCLVWNKLKMGCGYWARIQHELLLVGTRGRFRPPAPALRIRSVLSIPRTTHSRKPSEIRDLIARWYPGERKLEMFAREKVENWDAWGNEVESDVAIGDGGAACSPAQVNVTPHTTRRDREGMRTRAKTNCERNEAEQQADGATPVAGHAEGPLIDEDGIIGIINSGSRTEASTKGK